MWVTLASIHPVPGLSGDLADEWAAACTLPADTVPSVLDAAQPRAGGDVPALCPACPRDVAEAEIPPHCSPPACKSLWDAIAAQGWMPLLPVDLQGP